MQAEGTVMQRKLFIAALVLSVLGLTGCASSNEPPPPAPSVPTITPSVTTTNPPVTQQPPVTTEKPSSDCAQAKSWPTTGLPESNAMPQSKLVDIRTGQHECFDRV